MVSYLTQCFKGLQRKSIDDVGETKPVYRDDLNEKPLRKTEYLAQPINKPLHDKEGLKPIRRNNGSDTTKKIKTKKVVRFAEEHTIIEPLSEKEGSMPSNNDVVKFHVETLNHREGFVVEEMKEEIIRVKIKMTKLEAQRLLSKRSQNAGVLELQHLADQIAHVPVHRVHVATVLVACNKKSRTTREV